MSFQRDRPKGTPDDSRRELESPFLDEELFVDAEAGSTEERASRLIGYQLESPFQFAFETESEASRQLEVDESKQKLYNEKEEVDEGEFEDEGDDQEYDEEFYDQEMEQWEQQVAPSSSAPIETKYIDKATSAHWLQKVDKAVRNHFKLGGPSLSGRVQFVTQAQFAKQFPESAILEHLLLLFLTPPLRVIQILRQHGKELLGGGEFDSAKERLRKLKKFLAERIKIGSFEIEERTPSDPKAGKHGQFVVNRITPRDLIAEFFPGVTISTTARKDRRVRVQLDSEVEVLIHEACHFYTHPKFLSAAKGKEGNLFFTGLLVSNILIEGFTEYFARQVLEANKTEFGSLGFAAYQSYVEAAGRFIATLEEKTAREAYFTGSEAAIKLLLKAIELNIQNFPLLVPGFMLEGETRTTSIAAEIEAEEPDELKDEEPEGAIAEDATDSEAPLSAGFVQERLPDEPALRAVDEEYEQDVPIEQAEATAQATPKGLVLLDHMHIPKTPKTPSPKVPSSFQVGALAILKTADMNPGFIDANDNLVVDTTSTGLQTCLQLLMTKSFQDLLGSRRQTVPGANDIVRIALVDLTETKLATPDLAGWGTTVAMYGASVPKILALYAAHQLRSDLRQLATQKKFSSGRQLEQAAVAEWNQKGITLQLPDLVWLFDIRNWNGAGPLDFTADAESAFTHIDHNCPAGTLIAKVGFPYIGSVTWQSGLYHPQRGGLWLRVAYCNKGRWSRESVHPPNIHNITALSAATYFTLMSQGRLVDDASSSAIQKSLAHACVSSLFPSLPVVASKCGIWNGYVHDCALIQDDTVRYVLVILSKQSTQKQAELYTQLCRELDSLIRKNHQHPKPTCP